MEPKTKRKKENKFKNSLIMIAKIYIYIYIAYLNYTVILSVMSLVHTDIIFLLTIHGQIVL